MNLESVLVTVIIVIRGLCKFIIDHRALIDQAIAASTGSPEDKAAFSAFLDATESVCDIVVQFEYPPF